MGSGVHEELAARLREFGPYWRHNYQANIGTGIGGNNDAAVVSRMGDRRYFSRGSQQNDGRTAWVPHDHGRTDRLFSRSILDGSATQWELYAADNILDVFVDGNLVSRSTHDGRTQYVTGGEQVAMVEDTFGRQLHFERDQEGRLSVLHLPGGNQLVFHHSQADEWPNTGAVGGENRYRNLVGVAYPDESVRHYHYNEPDHTDGGSVPPALTGITDENGSRYSDYYYSSSGIAARSVIGGVINTSVNGWAYTDPLGSSYTSLTTMVNGEQRITGSNKPGGSGCSPSSSSITYDTAGNVESRTDFAKHKTCYANDSRNLEAKRVEGLSSSANCTSALTAPPAPTAANPTRVVSTQWHPDWNLESRRAEPKKITTWVYNGQPDPTGGGGAAACAPGSALLPDGKPIAVLCKKVEQATSDATGTAGFSATVTGSPRTWTWTYNAFGQVLTANGPRTDVDDTTTYTYYTDTADDHTLGDLASIRDPLGHFTYYTRYDKNGRPLTIADANGLTTTLTYTPRGWLKTREVGSQLTTYDYDAVGQLKKVTAPDNSWIGYDYDPAHRLTDIYDNRGNRITYTLDPAGNRTKEEVTDPSGNLARSQTREYDALSRLKNIFQPE